MKQNNTLPIVCFLLCVLMLGIGYHLKNSMEPMEIIKIDTITNTDTIWKDTTITKTKTVLKYVKETYRDTLYLKNGKDTILTTENKTYQDSILCGADTINYLIHISGIKSNLDSISLRLKKSEVIKTNTITVEKYIKDNKRFNWGIQGGIGYGFTSKQIEPFVGIGIQINL